MTVQIVELGGQKMALLPESDYRLLVDALEDRIDIAAAENAEARRLAGEEYVPAALVDRIMGGESALRVWREYRGLSGVELAAAAGMEPSALSKLETGAHQGKPAQWRKLATALGLQVDDILPLAD